MTGGGSDTAIPYKATFLNNGDEFPARIHIAIGKNTAAGPLRQSRTPTSLLRPSGTVRNTLSIPRRRRSRRFSFFHFGLSKLKLNEN